MPTGCGRDAFADLREDVLDNVPQISLSPPVQACRVPCVLGVILKLSIHRVLNVLPYICKCQDSYPQFTEGTSPPTPNLVCNDLFAI